MRKIMRAILLNIVLFSIALFVGVSGFFGVMGLLSPDVYDEPPVVAGAHVTNVEYGGNTVYADVEIPAIVDGKAVTIQDHIALTGIGAGEKYTLSSEIVRADGNRFDVKETLVQNDSASGGFPWLILAVWYIGSVVVGLLYYLFVWTWKRLAGDIYC